MVYTNSRIRKEELKKMKSDNDYVLDLIFYFDGNDKKFNENQANLYLNDLSNAELSTERINKIIEDYKNI